MSPHPRASQRRTKTLPAVLQRRRTLSPSPSSRASSPDPPLSPNAVLPQTNTDHMKRSSAFWHRFSGKLRTSPMPTVWQSARSLRTHGAFNLALLFVPVAWMLQLTYWRTSDGTTHRVGPGWRFALNMVAIVPLQKRFEWLGEEMVPYLGAELGELLNITLSNTVEALLAIGLLVRDSYRLLQMTVVGVVLLHILLVPGVAFLTGGAKIIEQELHTRKTQINHTLLTLGVMAVAVPAAFFAALDRGNLRDLTEFTTHLAVDTPDRISGTVRFRVNPPSPCGALPARVACCYPG